MTPSLGLRAGDNGEHLPREGGSVAVILWQFDGYPNRQVTQTRLNQALEQFGRKDEIRLEHVETRTTRRDWASAGHPRSLSGS